MLQLQHSNYILIKPIIKFYSLVVGISCLSIKSWNGARYGKMVIQLRTSTTRDLRALLVPIKIKKQPYFNNNHYLADICKWQRVAVTKKNFINQSFGIGVKLIGSSKCRIARSKRISTTDIFVHFFLSYGHYY